MYKKGVSVLLLGVFIICVLASCTANDKYAEEIVGRWECKDGNETLIFVFNADGTGTARLSPSEGLENIQIKYTLKGERITIVSYPEDNQGIAVGKGEYEIRYYDKNFQLRPYGSDTKPHIFIKLAD